MKEGDIWLQHFRGTRYNFSSPDKVYYQFHLSAGGQRLDANGDFADLVARLTNVKGMSGGRLYVTEGLHVLIVKKGVHNGKSAWYPYYVTTLNHPFVFAEFQGEFKDLVPGDIWPSFNFHAGSHYSIAGQRWNYTLFWRLRQSDAVCPLTSNHPDLRKALINSDWRGGGFYVTEHGHVWRSTEKARVKNQAIERLKKRPDHVLRTVSIYYDYLEGRLPVYVGHFKDRFEISDYQGPSEIANETEY